MPVSDYNYLKLLEFVKQCAVLELDDESIADLRRLAQLLPYAVCPINNLIADAREVLKEIGGF